MQSEERELITGLFGRLQPFESQPRDGEAEALIKDLAVRQPAAPYLLVQTVLVQEQALGSLQARVQYDAPVSAPVSNGRELGKLLVSGQGVPEMEVPLIAGADVDRLGLIPRIPAVIGRWGNPFRQMSFASSCRTRRARHPTFSRASSPRRFRRAKAGT